MDSKKVIDTVARIATVNQGMKHAKQVTIAIIDLTFKTCSSRLNCCCTASDLNFFKVLVAITDTAFTTIVDQKSFATR